MRIALFSLLLIFYSAALICQDIRPAVYTGHSLCSVVSRYTKMETVMYWHRADACARYRHKKAGGIVLCCLGGAVLASGIYLVARGVHVNNEPGMADDGTSGVIGGGILMALGATGLATGLPLAIIYSPKIRKNCKGIKNGNAMHAYAMLSTYGNGLALDF